ncbi:MAG: CHAT domain-containing tetratricopeptide repeat protein [Nannocystaceae bacterium]
MDAMGFWARPRGRARRALLLALRLSACATLLLSTRGAAAAGDEAKARRAVDEFNRGLEMLRQGDLAGLKVAKQAAAIIEAELGADHPTAVQTSSTLLLMRFQVRSAKLDLALKQTRPNGPRMTSAWAVSLAKELRQEGEDALAKGDRAGLQKLEQAYLYALFGVRDPMSEFIAGYSGALSSAYRKLGDEARAQGIEDGDLPAGAVIPDILLSMEMKTLYEQANAAEQARDWPRAIEKQEQLVALLERELGADADELIKWWSDLATYYTIAGRLDEAEAVLARAEQKVMKTYGPQSPRARQFYQQLAAQFLMRGDVTRANLYRAKVWELARKAPLSDRGVLLDLLTYVDSLVSRRQLKEARSAIADIERRFQAVGDVEPSLQLRLVLVSVGLLDEEGDHAEANRRLIAAEALADKIDDRSARFLYHRTAAEHARGAGEYPTAGRHFAKAGEVGSVAEVVTSGMFESAAMMYWAAGRVDDAIANADRAGASMDAHLPTLLVSGTDEEKRKQLLFAGLQVDALVSLAAEGYPENSPAAAIALRTLVRRKAVVLDAITRAGEVARQSDAASEQLKTQAALRERLASVVYHPSPRDFYDDEELQALVRDIDSTERAIATAVQGAGASEQTVTLDDLRALLPDDGALVEFVTYRPTDPQKAGKDQKAARRYAAFVLPKSGDPVVVPLAGAEEIEGRVTTLRKALSSPRGKYKEPARGLHDALLGPLGPHLKGVTHLVLAPDGALNLVPFAALLDGDGGFLLDRYTITYVSSGRELSRLRDTQASSSAAVLVGAPDFDNAGDGAKAPEGKRKALRFSKLPGTAEEVEALGAVVPDATVMTGADASERGLKAVDRPVLVHVATHGFFLTGDAEALTGARALEYDAGAPAPEGGEEAAEASGAWLTSQNPLLRSGVALAGANTRVGGDDGILTALEVASMDLRGTELVVLSACETGVGEVADGEGVYGLRRALTIAGARAQVMSLWKVDDAATRDLMIAYYKQLAKGDGRGEALRDAQRALRKDDKRQHPYYWAAFIPSGAWGPMRLTPGAPPSSAAPETKPGRTRVLDYWKHPPRNPTLYIGGSYSAPITLERFEGSEVTQRHGFGVDLLFHVPPRWLLGLSFTRTMWDLAASAARPNPFEAKLAKLELVVGVDVLAMPRDWRVRPAINAWVGGGLAWTRQRELIDDAESDGAFGLSGTFGADAQLHIRFTKRVDMRLGGGVTKSGYLLSNDTITGAAKFPGAWRWMVGGAFGFIF